MNTSGIEALLDKYYEGTTTLVEEETLRDFFTRRDVPAHLMQHQPIFTYFVDMQKIEYNDQAFEKTLLGELSGKPPQSVVVEMHPNRGRLRFISTLAASILLLIGLFFTFQHDIFKRTLTQSTKAEHEMAFADASEVLMLVSGNLNNGLRQMERLQMVDKAMKNMQLFSKFYQYQPIIINQDEIQQKSTNSK
jgi:hypothetical protein